LTSGEVFLWGVIHQMVLCSETPLNDAPNLRRWYDRIAAHPKTKEVLEGTSPMGNMGQYFINPP
jgi:glutathione S-transferase